jgi:hypothetical protein
MASAGKYKKNIMGYASVHPVQQTVAHAAHGHFIIPWWQQLWPGVV